MSGDTPSAAGTNAPEAPTAPRTISLLGDPTSPGAARRFLRELLESAGHAEWVEAAELAVSEVVTNAVLHAHTEVEVSAQVEDDQVRISVRDSSPTLPSQRDYDSHATTGRGLDLVAAVTREHGVQSLGGEGKVVWFCVGDQAVELSVDDLLDQWDDGDLDDDSGLPAATGTTVVLRGMPPTLWLAAREHHDALLRELALHLAGDVGAELPDLAAADRARFAISGAVMAEVEQARRQGRAARPLPAHHPGALPEVPGAFDLTLTVAPEQALDFAALQDALDEGERLAASDRLLVHPGLPEVVAVRDWACEQVIAQLGGAPAAPWPGTDDERFNDVDVSDLATDHGWDDGLVRSSASGAVAVDDANRVVSISEPLAREIGWRPEDLVGRRVVAIVPPRFREAHVAGFSRHLSTGDARAIGTALQLPVLRADGSEVLCSFLIESHRSPTGRQVYVAWIAPLREDEPAPAG